MKKIILCSLLSLSPFSSVMADNTHGPAGCGLGTEIIFRNADEWHEHVLAASTNFSASQTFAMTSGTLGCEDANGPLKHAVITFIDQNLEQLAVDSATGEGETLSALSELIGISNKDDIFFKEALKTNFDGLFNSAKTTSADTFNALVNLMKESARLAKYVS